VFEHGRDLGFERRDAGIEVGADFVELLPDRGDNDRPLEECVALDSYFSADQVP